MTLAIWYWLIMALWLIFGFFGYWPAPENRRWRDFAPFGSHIVLFLLFLIIGFRIFGGPVR